MAQARRASEGQRERAREERPPARAHTMPADASVERRLVALESAVAELQRRLGEGAPTSNWVERFTGSFKDEPAFAEVVEYGKALRAADRPPEGPEP